MWLQSLTNQIFNIFILRAHGECGNPCQRTTKANTSSTHGPSLSCPSFSSTRRLARHAPSDPVSRTAGPASPHGPASETEPHHAHPEAQRPGSSGDPSGKRVQVRSGPALLYLVFKHNTLLFQPLMSLFHPSGYKLESHIVFRIWRTFLVL